MPGCQSRRRSKNPRRTLRNRRVVRDTSPWSSCVADYSESFQPSGRQPTRVGCHSEPAAAGEESAVSCLWGKADPCKFTNEVQQADKVVLPWEPTDNCYWKSVVR